MQRIARWPRSHVDPLDGLLGALDNFEELNERTSLIVRERQGRAVRDPAVDASSPRVHPKKVAESELFCGDEAQKPRVSSYANALLTPSSTHLSMYDPTP